MNNGFKKVLISGFEPFDGDKINPSAELLTWLSSQSFNFEVVTQVLPVSFKQAYPILKNKIRAENPTHVLLTGFAKNSTELALERIAINWVDARIPDNLGMVIKTSKISQTGADGYFTTLPILSMLEAAKKVGCPCHISTSAGEFVCNYLIYMYLLEEKKIPGTFIHLPKADSYEIFYQGVREIILSL